MIHPKRVLALLVAVVAFLFVSCTKVDDEVLATVVDAPVLTFENVETEGTLESGNAVNFIVTLKNEGGFDSTGLYVYAELNGESVAFRKTSPTAADSSVSVSIPWKAVAGDHEFWFTVEKAAGDTSKVLKGTKLPVSIAIKALEQKTSVVVDAAEKETVIDDVFGEEEEIDAIFENIDEKIEAATDDNEKAVLEAVKTVADNGLKLSTTVNPTKVTFEDTSVTTVVFPLAKTVVDPVTQVETEVLDTTTFFVAVEVTEEVATEKAVVDGVEVVTKTETKKTTIPVTVDIKEAPEGSAVKYSSIEIRNGLGGFSIDAVTGVITPLTRAVDEEFWVVMKDELAAASAKFLAVVMNPASTSQDVFIASIVYTNEYAAIVIAYELQKQVTNEPPVITIVPSTGSEEYRQGNDLVILSWDIFTASVTDDKPGAYIDGLSVFNPGVTGGATMLDQLHTFTAIDSDGVTSSVTVTSKYKKVIIEDVFIHDQGEGGN